MGTLLNRRGEWGQNLPPQLTLDDGESGGAKRSNGRQTTGASQRPQNPQRSKTPPPPASKRLRVVESLNAPLEDRIRVEPKVLTIKQILERMKVPGTRVRDKHTSGASNKKVAELKTIEIEKQATNENLDLRGEGGLGESASNLTKLPGIREVYKENIESGEHLRESVVVNSGHITEEGLRRDPETSRLRQHSVIPKSL